MKEIKRFYRPFKCQIWHISHFISIYFCTFFLCGAYQLCVSIMRSVVIINPIIWTVWVTAYVCTKEIYRPQRDSNPVPPGSESTTLPMSYPERDICTCIYKFVNLLKSYDNIPHLNCQCYSYLLTCILKHVKSSKQNRMYLDMNISMYKNFSWPSVKWYLGFFDGIYIFNIN